MNIVYLSTEAVPFAKTGGLADVCGALPIEMAKLDHRCELIMPAFRSVHQCGLPIESTDISFAIAMGDRKVVGCRLLRSHLPGGDVPVWLIDQPQYFDRPSLYGDKHGDYPDNAERFAFFCRAAIIAMGRINRRIDVVHCNDWQTALVPALVRLGDAAPDGLPVSLQNASTLLTIHNLAYQGNFGADQFRWLQLGGEHFVSESFEYYGQLNFLKAGIVTADAISTVSPTYAEEIKTPQQGCGFDGILRDLSDRVSGIINGIDLRAWDPSVDTKLHARYDASSWVEGKRENKLALQTEVGLPQSANVPLIGLVGRLADQKGWDLIMPVLRRHVEQNRPTQWVVLGSGSGAIEEQLRQLSTEYPHQLAAHIGFSDTLAHRIEAAADLFVMPSHYEPCGLNQLYSLRYGTVCVVTPTGGLADTIVNADTASVAADTATGFVMNDVSVDALDEAIGRALRVRYHEPETWKKIIRRGMTSEWSWRKSAAQYAELYARSISLSRQRKKGPQLRSVF